jgi:hypothetical protein
MLMTSWIHTGLLVENFFAKQVHGRLRKRCRLWGLYLDRTGSRSSPMTHFGTTVWISAIALVFVPVTVWICLFIFLPFLKFFSWIAYMA